MQKEKNLTVGQWCGQWLTANRHKWNGNTEGGYRNLIYGHILPNIGSVALSDLTEQAVKDFYDSLRSQGLSARSIWCVHLLLRRCMDEDGTGTAHSIQPGAVLPGTKGRGIQSSPSAIGATPALPERSGTARRAPDYLHRTIKRPAAM